MASCSAGEPSGMQKQAVSLYQTSDGGATWTLKYANDPSQPNNTLPFSGHKNGMAFRDTSTGWVGGDIPINGFVYLYKTTNGGVTWSQQPLTLPAGYEICLHQHNRTNFLRRERCRPAGLDDHGSRHARSVHLRHPRWRRDLDSLSSFARNGDLTDFVSVRDGFSWDAAGFFHVTNDAGASWSTDNAKRKLWR